MRFLSPRLLAIAAVSWLFDVGFATAAFGTAPPATPILAAEDACSSLQASLGSTIVQSSGGKDYSSGTSNAWSYLNNQQQPSCIVFPQKAAHVQTAMTAIYRNNARYAVQAGGHSAVTGWNNVQGGVLIFFSRMKNVSYNATRDTIALDPGIHWGDALTQLEKFGVAPAGGRLNDVGTGLLLGGGYSYLAGEYGFSSDLYVEVDVVLVNGTLVTATASNHYADLFRALKGGANRFGIVTRYEVQAIHTGRISDKNWFGGLIMYPNSSADALIQAVEKYVRTVNDPKASILMAFSNVVNGPGPRSVQDPTPAIGPMHILTLFYHGTSLPSNIFGDFLAIPSVTKQLGAVSYIDAQNILGNGGDRGYGQLFGASVLQGGAGLDQYQAAFRLWSNYTSTVRSNSYATVLAFTPIQVSQIQAGRDKGGNLMDPPLSNYAAVQIQTQMTKGLKDSSGIQGPRQQLFKELPRTPGYPLYINECDSSQSVFETYGRYSEMKTTYAKYDPTRFNVRFTDGPSGL
ncbi:hypothetical protein CPB83DRAFT_860445 [Crepidotus variabilis]|uniref:FAD-binding PCMH-type domain-containing protein n=1 Tax=Crepidotus variabilis TaxID=179855 RepID=A0A9P6E9M2_9AGAR|nr:hypothetical protein CPB83DRAFT_860445 [Crepidotus variabilis]